MRHANLFRGRPVYFNSIFVDGFALFLDVWSRNGVGPIDNGVSKSKSRRGCTYSLSGASGTFRQVPGEVFFPLTSLYHGCQSSVVGGELRQ